MIGLKSPEIIIPDPESMLNYTKKWEAERGRLNKSRTTSRRCRIALYSHDTMGLGHMRRNLLIAQTLASSNIDPTILMIAGAKEIGEFPLPENVDCLVLPSYHKTLNGNYQPRNLKVENHELHELRENTIFSVLKSFKPDVFIVDNVPDGALGELNLVLNYLRKKTSTRCVLGLRDIQDESTVSRRQYLSIEKAYRDYYDMIWIYGDPAVYDLTIESKFSQEIIKKVYYTGYFDQRNRINLANIFNINRELNELFNFRKKLVVCMLGGGQDGARLAESFIAAKLPENYYGILVTGPYLPDDIKHKLLNDCAKEKNIRILDFIKEPGYLIEKADRVITMGGYNSICEVLSLEKKSLIVPRIEPRKEQWIRASRLQQMGVVDMLHPDEVSPEKITDWLMSDGPEIKGAREKINLNGLQMLSSLINLIARK
ncbi:MAG: glycosyltransferase [Gammaproteobacteria bacterium]|nr:glycosyltransferase [Gammaproteobacteria bacterium]